MGILRQRKRKQKAREYYHQQLSQITKTCPHNLYYAITPKAIKAETTAKYLLSKDNIYCYSIHGK